MYRFGILILFLSHTLRSLNVQGANVYQMRKTQKALLIRYQSESERAEIGIRMEPSAESRNKSKLKSENVKQRKSRNVLAERH